MFKPAIDTAATAPPLHAIAVLIPAWKPEPALPRIVSGLIDAGIGTVILVDDGNRGESFALLEAAASPARVQIVRHAVNLGKGRALKSGINAFLAQHQSFTGLVTADADGQHTVPDILAVAAQLAGTQQVVLGARTFSASVPLRSRFGNTLTRRLFGFVTGVRLQHTQTGLRRIPAALLTELLPLERERYEYEMTVLSHICRAGHPIIELPIATVYTDGNRSSHFDPLRDSMRIYFVLLRFYFSSIVAAALDFAGFTLAFALTGNLLASVAVGRLSSLVNFALNRRFVFHNRGPVPGALTRYYALVVAIAALSYILIWSLSRYLRWNVFAAKITVDILLSLVSFAVQRTFVFRRATEAQESASLR